MKTARMNTKLKRSKTYEFILDHFKPDDFLIITFKSSETPFESTNRY